MVLYRLSLAWGIPVDELAERLTAAQLRGYVTYYAVEPWGCEAEDWRFQQLAYITAQSQSTKRLNPDDFAPPWRKPVRRLVPFEVGLAALVAHHERHQRN